MIGKYVSQSRDSLFVYFLDLYGQARILLLDALTNGVISALVLAILVPEHVVAVLNGLFYDLVMRLGEVELHNGVVFELTLADEI